MDSYILQTDKEIQNMIADGNNLFAVGSKGLLVFDLTEPAKPNLIGHVKSEMDGSTSRNINSSFLAKSGSKLLVESGWSGCMMLDASNPISPSFNDLIAYTGVMSDIKYLNQNTVALIDGYSLHFHRISQNV